MAGETTTSFDTTVFRADTADFERGTQKLARDSLGFVGSMKDMVRGTLPVEHAIGRLSFDISQLAESAGGLGTKMGGALAGLGTFLGPLGIAAAMGAALFGLISAFRQLGETAEEAAKKQQAAAEAAKKHMQELHEALTAEAERQLGSAEEKALADAERILGRLAAKYSSAQEAAINAPAAVKLARDSLKAAGITGVDSYIAAYDDAEARLEESARKTGKKTGDAMVKAVKATVSPALSRMLAESIATSVGGQRQQEAAQLLGGVSDTDIAGGRALAFFEAQADAAQADATRAAEALTALGDHQREVFQGVSDSLAELGITPDRSLVDAIAPEEDVQAVIARMDLMALQMSASLKQIGDAARLSAAAGFQSMFAAIFAGKGALGGLKVFAKGFGQTIGQMELVEAARDFAKAASALWTPGLQVAVPGLLKSGGMHLAVAASAFALGGGGGIGGGGGGGGGGGPIATTGTSLGGGAPGSRDLQTQTVIYVTVSPGASVEAADAQIRNMQAWERDRGRAAPIGGGRA